MITPDPSQVIKALNFLHPGGAVFEMCAIGLNNPKSSLWEGFAGGKKAIVAGWFGDPGKAAALATKINATGIYVTLNSCPKALLARGNQRLIANVDRTKDQEIARITNLLIDIDVDPGGISGISSTDAEHEDALEMAQIIQADLTKEGWTEPLVGDSGNGGHLIYPVDLPNDREGQSTGLIKRILEALSLRYAEQLKIRNLGIDTGVYNPGRLVKVYGSLARKGDSTPDRPHRLAQIIALPEIR